MAPKAYVICYTRFKLCRVSHRAAARPETPTYGIFNIISSGSAFQIRLRRRRNPTISERKTRQVTPFLMRGYDLPERVFFGGRYW